MVEQLSGLHIECAGPRQCRLNSFVKTLVEERNIVLLVAVQAPSNFLKRHDSNMPIGFANNQNRLFMFLMPKELATMRRSSNLKQI